MLRTVRSHARPLAALLLAAPLAAPAPAQTAVARVNCGGGSLVVGGATFAGDQAYAPGGFGTVGGSGVVTAENRVGPVASPYVQLTKTARQGWSAYRFDVANGNYLVRLHLCEIVEHGPGLRRFTVRLEGADALVDVDLAARYGHDYGAVATLPVVVSDGRLDVEPVLDVGDSILNGIEVFRVDTAPPLPAKPTGVAVKWSYGANVLTFDRVDAPSLLGYRVEAADGPGGAFQPLATLWSQPASYVDRDAPVGVERRYRVVPLGASGEGPTSDVVAATARDASTSKLRVYELTIDPADQRQLDLLFKTEPDFEIPVDLAVDGRHYAATLRYSGFTSGDDPKKSYKLRFGQGQHFQDRRELNLKSHFSDDALIRQELARRMYVAAGHATPHTEWIHLEINGEFAGVFEDLEVIEEDFLRHRELAKGSVYQAYLNYVSTLYPVDPLTGNTYQTAYKQKVGDDPAYTDLVDFVDDLTATPVANIRPWLARTVDTTDYLAYLAATSIVDDLEKVVRDYHLYLDPDVGRWHVYTWDNDATWKQNNVSYAFGSYPSWIGQNQLTTKVLSDPTFRWNFKRKIEALLDGAASPEVGGAFDQLVQSQRDLVEEDVLADYRKFGWEDDGPYLASVTAIRVQAQVRKNAILSQFAGDPVGAMPQPLWIDEVMASNRSTIADPAGEFDDWVEIVNAGTSTVDLTGHLLTDDPAVPTKWTFPSGTTLAAGARLVVWCDGDVGQAGLHASFSLRAGGEAVALFAPGGTQLLDVVHFGPQRDDISFQRREGPSPQPILEFSNEPTPGAPNVTSDNLPPYLRLVSVSPSAPQPGEVVTVGAHVDDEDVDVVELHVRVGPGAFAILPLTDLGSGWFETTIGPFAAGQTVEYWVRALDEYGDVSVFPGDAPSEVESFTVVVPTSEGLFVNEVCADNDGLLTDPQGQYEDFVELVNPTAFAIDLVDHYLTDDLANPTKFALPSGTVVPPGGRVLVWCDGDVADGPLHASFSLSKDGEEIGVFRDDGGPAPVLVDGFAFGPMPTDTSVGGVLDGQLPRVRLLDPSPGSANLPTPGGHVRYDSAVGAGAPLDLTFAGSLAPGAAFELSTTDAPFVPALLAVSFFPASVELAPGLPLLVDPGVAFLFGSTTDVAGHVAFPLSVPPYPQLAGTSLFAQALLGSTLFGGRITSAVALRLGP
ncbi:MAG: CotH kinase family protein [Planctomycetota bacterium]